MERLTSPKCAYCEGENNQFVLLNVSSEYRDDEISYLCGSHGVCVDCEVPPNVYCAYGKRRAENEK